MIDVAKEEEQMALIKLETKKQEDLVLKTDPNKYLFMYYEGETELELIFVSKSMEIRALEFIDFIASEFGLIRGNATRATAVIANSIVKSNMTYLDEPSIEKYLASLMHDYFTQTEWIDAKEFSKKYKTRIKSLDIYKKKLVKWAVVRPADILPLGELYSIKSLENESGEVHTVVDNEYIMIGSRGEVYAITKEKFDASYEMTGERLDVFTQMLKYIPCIKVVSSDRNISIEDSASLCQPKNLTRIYAGQLNKRTKIFSASGNGDYFLGYANDYMAIREDDITDIYIIRKDIFKETYALDN